MARRGDRLTVVCARASLRHSGPLPEEKIEAQLRAVLADKPGNECVLPSPMHTHTAPTCGRLC